MWTKISASQSDSTLSAPSWSGRLLTCCTGARRCAAATIAAIGTKSREARRRHARRRAGTLCSRKERRRKMASVRKGKQKNGTVFYQAVWSVVGIDGQRKQQSKAFAKIADARSHANRMAEEVENRLVADPHHHTVKEYLSRWLATLR